MSSLAATQADGYYVPVEYFESGAYKKKSKNQWNNNNKAKTEGPPVVRFELPYSGTCNHCGHFILRGTRYNAQKTPAGKYYTSQIWEFKIKCRNCCEQTFVLRTNPKEQSFDYVSGITKQQRHLPANNNDDNDNNSSDEEQDEIRLAQLETMAKGHRKTMSERDQLEALQKSSTKLYYQDASSNAAVRAKFRVERKDRKKRRRDAQALGYREGISLLDATVEDQVEAKETTFGDGRDKEQKKFGKARASSIFSQKTKKRKQSTASRNASIPVIPDGVVSSATGVKPTEVVSKPKPTKKKVLVVGLGTASIAPKKASSILDAYASDSS